RMRGPILGLGGLQVLISAAAIGGVTLAFGQPWRVAVALGFILALSSTAMVLQTLTEKGWIKTDAGQSAFSVLLFQDIAVIPLLAFIPLLATADSLRATGAGAGGEYGKTLVDLVPPWAEPAVVLGAVALVVLVGRYLTRPVFSYIARTRLRELFTAATLLMVIGIALLMTQVGLSPALGTFLAGVLLANSQYRHELEIEIQPFKGLLLGLFFIAVGASIDFALVGEQKGLIAALVVLLVAIKWVVLFGLGGAFRMGLDQRLLFTFVLAQGGEFAFVLVSFAAQHGIMGPEVTGPVIAAVALSMAMTPILLVIVEKALLPRIGTHERSERESDLIAGAANPVIVAGFGRFGSTVGRLLRASGVGATVLDFNSDRVDLLRKLGLEVFYGDAMRPDLLHAAGAEEAQLIVLALDTPEKNLELSRVVRTHYPHLEILIRSRDRADAYEMLDSGLSSVYRETQGTALKVGADVLQKLGRTPAQAARSAELFQQHDEETLRELAAMRHDRAKYLSRAREKIQLLETLLLQDQESAGDPEVSGSARE
ncbi:MAG: cation:proton antiporter, partial [Acidobacteriota bacterium]